MSVSSNFSTGSITDSNNGYTSLVSPKIQKNDRTPLKKEDKKAKADEKVKELVQKTEESDTKSAASASAAAFPPSPKVSKSLKFTDTNIKNVLFEQADYLAEALFKEADAGDLLDLLEKYENSNKARLVLVVKSIKEFKVKHTSSTTSAAIPAIKAKIPTDEIEKLKWLLVKADLEERVNPKEILEAVVSILKEGGNINKELEQLASICERRIELLKSLIAGITCNIKEGQTGCASLRERATIAHREKQQDLAKRMNEIMQAIEELNQDMNTTEENIPEIEAAIKLLNNTGREKEASEAKKELKKIEADNETKFKEKRALLDQFKSQPNDLDQRLTRAADRLHAFTLKQTRLLAIKKEEKSTCEAILNIAKYFYTDE